MKNNKDIYKDASSELSFMFFISIFNLRMFKPNFQWINIFTGKAE